MENKAYTEVLEVIKYLPMEERSKIPIEMIDFFKKNMDINYFFKFDPNMDLDKQNISEEANAILIILFRNHFLTETQKIKLNEILKLNETISEKKKEKTYNLNTIFKNVKNTKNTKNNLENNTSEEWAIIEYKEKNFFQKIVKKIKCLFKRG